MSRQVLGVTARGPTDPAGEIHLFRRGRAPPWCLGGFPKPSTGPSDAITTASELLTLRELVLELGRHAAKVLDVFAADTE